MDPSSPQTLFARGNSHLALGCWDAAAEAFRQALAQLPQDAAIHANLAFALEKLGYDDEAEAHYRAAQDDDDPAILLNFFGLLLRQKRLDEAGLIAFRALAQDAASPRAWTAQGLVYACRQNDAEAEECYRTALELDPAYSYARFNLAYVLLRNGHLAEGWACLEARESLLGVAARMKTMRWQGEPLAGKSILIACEGGHGDMIQFARFAKVLKATGALRVGLQCQPGLVRLFKTMPDIDRVLDLGEAASGWDYWVAAFSLPFFCQTTPGTIPADLPYLHAAGSARLPEGQDLRVGLVWRGSPQFENDADRSMSLAEFAPLAGLAQFISLQKGAGEDELAPEGMDLWRPEGLADFADTAALIGELDLVISVDSAVAHLAAALGKPCWVLLPHYKTDWRWLKNREDSPWYPGVMRLFRQKAGGWAEVMQEVCAALSDMKKA